jgi:hypothetical protein
MRGCLSDDDRAAWWNYKKKPAVILSNEVECDEAYVIAGHKGQPEVVKSKERKGRRRQLRGKGGRSTMEKERPPVLGMIERGGQVVIRLLDNVKQKTIEPFITDTIELGTQNRHLMPWRHLSTEACGIFPTHLRTEKYTSSGTKSRLIWS